MDCRWSGWDDLKRQYQSDVVRTCACVEGRVVLPGERVNLVIGKRVHFAMPKSSQAAGRPLTYVLSWVPKFFNDKLVVAVNGEWSGSFANTII